MNPSLVARSAAGYDGVRIAYQARRAAPGAPTFVLAHATGFCGGVWRPVVAGLMTAVDGAGLIVVDQRAHGASQRSGHPFDWWDTGRDLLAVIRTEAASAPIIGIGHSGGGAGVALGAIIDPAVFDGLVLVEPIIPPPPHQRPHDTPIASSAERRRSWFPSRMAAGERWRQRLAFANWHRDAFDGYLSHGLVPGPHPETGEGGYVLSCAPDDEAEWFRSTWEHGGWDRLDELSCPVTIIAGTASETHGTGLAKAQADRIASADLTMVDGGSHFIPMEHPEIVVDETLALMSCISRE